MDSIFFASYFVENAFNKITYYSAIAASDFMVGHLINSLLLSTSVLLMPTGGFSGGLLLEK